MTTIYNDGNRRVARLGTPTAGGAFASYGVYESDSIDPLATIYFQPDTIPNVGVVGNTNETLISMVIDRLECFQASQFSCAENQFALENLKEALNCLEERTRNRQQRGVEGTHEA